METWQVKYLKDCRLLDDIDVRFSDFLVRLSGHGDGRALYPAALLLNNTITREQHICLDLAECAGKSLADLFSDLPDDHPLPVDERLPDLETWMALLADDPVVGAPGDYAPLVLDRPGRRLYLYRDWDYEQKLAAAVRNRLVVPGRAIDEDLLRRGLERFFPAAAAGSADDSSPDFFPDRQKTAAFAALTRNFCVITGGPGTGKTHTVTAIIALLLEQQPDMTIALTAPTGKAAVRLRESIAAAVTDRSRETAWPENMPDAVVTIHRLLGGRRSGPGFRYHAGNRLAVDTLIVDEASMVSMTLMSRLLQTLPESAAVILLGDRNQLASVEAGAVLGDICRAAAADDFSPGFRDRYAAVTGETIPAGTGPGGPLDDAVVDLKKSYRFAPGSSIDIVSRAVRQGEAEQVRRHLDGKKAGDISLRELPDREALSAALLPYVEDWIRPVFKAATPAGAFDMVGKFRILCAHRQGLFGVEGINRLVTAILVEQGVIDPPASVYRGRPVIITRNDYRLNLFNGDVGLFWDDAGGDLRACFPEADNRFRSLPALLLPDHDTVYAMTIHKSQGSEFERVLMILPEKISPVLSRELIYTGISRAVKRVDIWAGEEVLRYAVAGRVSRRSGLKEALKGPLPEALFHKGDDRLKTKGGVKK